ncbi:MAG: hypothetical protein ABGY11_12390 [Candidatus Thioglobus sp.]
MGFETGSSMNFDPAVAGQTNSSWLPEVFSKKVQVAFRKSAVAEAICNTDYMGEIAQFGDTVNIIKEPQISVNSYTRDATLSSTNLTDEELVLQVDQAKYFQFEVDDLEARFSHVNWQQIASDNAAYKLKDAFDSNVLSAAVTGATTNTYGTSAVPIDTGHGTSEVDPLNVLARLARQLDDNNVPEENRWVVAAPQFYEELAQTSSKLMSVDYNQGDGGLRNGLVASGLLRGFKMYKSNNMPTVTGTGSFSGSSLPTVLAGHMSAMSCAQSLSTVETVRSTTSFRDIVRGLLVWGRKVLRPESLALATITID